MPSETDFFCTLEFPGKRLYLLNCWIFSCACNFFPISLFCFTPPPPFYFFSFLLHSAHIKVGSKTLLGTRQNHKRLQESHHKLNSTNCTFFMEVLAFSACLDPSIIDYPKVGKNEQYKISRTGSSDHLVEQHDLCTFRVLNLKATGNRM